MLEKISKQLGYVFTFMAYGSGVMCLLILALVLGEIFARTFLHTSLLITLEVSTWLFLAMSFLGLGWVLKEDGHIRVTLIVRHLPQRARLWIDISLTAICTVFFAWFSADLWGSLIASYASGGVGYTPKYFIPLWPVWVPMFLGMVMLTIQFICLLFGDIIALKRLSYERGATLALSLLIATILGLGIWLLVTSLVITGVGWAIALLILLLLLFGLIGTSLWIGASLMIVGTVMLSLFTQYPVAHIIPRVSFSCLSSFVLVAVPLFIFMGELFYHTGISNSLYTGVSSWLNRVPGGLLHSNIVACTIFAAISGSSVATTAAIGSVAIPELDRRGYQRPISIGSLAGAGTLGLLIPPSIIAIIYGALTATSVGQLYLAGVIPGLMVAGLFMTYIVVAVVRQPSLAPPKQAATWRQRMLSVRQVFPALATIVLVLGLIYTGITTPTEAAAIGCACALFLAGIYKNLNWSTLRKVLLATVRITCMVELIYIGASIVSSAMAYLLIPQELVAALIATHISKYVLLGALCFLYILLGCLFDGVSMMLLTLPVVFPIVVGLGFDPVWFGVVLIVLIETAQITPPVGLNLYVLEGVTGEKLLDIAKYALPFFFLLLLAVVVLILFPNIALWLPSTV